MTDLMLLVAFGGGGLGIAIGWLVVYFLHRFEEFSAKSLGSVVVIVAGGTITTFLGRNGGNLTSYAWGGYCLGLCFGVVFFGATGTGQMTTKLQTASQDPRLRMIDALYENYRADKLSLSEYNEAKERILSDIKGDPNLRTTSQGNRKVT